MELLAHVAFLLGLVAYSVASTLFFLDLARREGSSVSAVWAPRVLGVAALVHAGHVVAASLFSRVCPVESIHFALSLAALLAVVVFLSLRVRRRLHAIGALVAPLGLTFMIGAQFVGATSPTAGVPRALLAVHVTANLAGVGLFLLAGAAGAFYLVQQRWLKEKRVTWLSSKLPPLDALDTTEHRLLLAGFPLLTLGVVTGGVFLGELGAHGAAAVLRAVLGYGSWVLLAGVLLMRAVAGWRGRRAAYGTLAGVGCVLLVILVYALKPDGGPTL
jgi:ABC-type uncharacterized transport system permease subunit